MTQTASNEMSNPLPMNRRRHAVALLLAPAACWAVLATAGYAPTRAWGGPGALTAMAAGQGLTVAAVYLTLVPAMLRMRRADVPGRFPLALRAAGVRFLLTLGLALAIAWREVVEPRAFLVWVGLGYVPTTMVETWALVSWSRQLEKQR